VLVILESLGFSHIGRDDSKAAHLVAQHAWICNNMVWVEDENYFYRPKDYSRVLYIFYFTLPLLGHYNNKKF
jgi:hypothetical protein